MHAGAGADPDSRMDLRALTHSRLHQLMQAQLNILRYLRHSAHANAGSGPAELHPARVLHSSWHEGASMHAVIGARAVATATSCLRKIMMSNLQSNGQRMPVVQLK